MEAWTPGDGRVLALWPAPVDHDACFAAAGFLEFADSTAGWDAEFGELVRALVQALEREGPARLQRGQYPVEPGALAALARLVGRQPRARSVSEALVAAARDDRFPPCVVHFGAPARAAVRTSSGHPLLWVWTSTSGPDREQLLASVAGDLPLVHTSLDWKALL